MSLVIILIVGTVFIATYSFISHKIEERRNNELNSSLRKLPKKVRRMPVAKPSVQYPGRPMGNVFTWRGYVESTSDVKKPKLGDIVYCNGKTVLFNDKEEWEEIGGLI